MIGLPPPSYFEKKFSQSDIEVAVNAERERCIKILADATKGETPCGNTWSALVACQVQIRDGNL